MTVVFATVLGFILALHVLNGRWELAAITLAVQTLAVLCGLAIRSGRVPPWALTPAMLVVIVAIDVSVNRQGPSGIFGAYPALLITYFLLPRPLARLCGALLIGSIGMIGVQAPDPSMIVRAVVTLLLLLLMIEVVLNVIGELQRQLALEANTDALTGAGNCRELQRWWGNAAVTAEHVGARGAALLAIDIDHFKRINDTFGHGAGDQVLVAAVKVMRTTMRPQDRLFRTGGEEFLLAMPDTDPGEAANKAEALRLRLADAPLLLGGAGVTASIGLARLMPGQLGEWALQAADRALYAAKAAGRNRVHHDLTPYPHAAG
jgi:diguanylate cyclase (GGDEF)-like protein